MFRELLRYSLALVPCAIAKSYRIAVERLSCSLSLGRDLWYGTDAARALLLHATGLRRSCRPALRRTLGRDFLGATSPSLSGLLEQIVFCSVRRDPQKSNNKGCRQLESKAVHVQTR